jgi:hypothetical protein
MSFQDPLMAKLGDYFVCLPKCEISGTNWIVYRDQFVFTVDAANLGEHLDPTAVPPDPNAAPTPANPAAPMPAEQAAIAIHRNSLTWWRAEEAIVKQGIASTILDSLFIKVKGAGMAPSVTAAAVGASSAIQRAHETWTKVKEEFEKKSNMMVVDL